MNADGIALLRALIFKLWAANEAREHGDCQSIADVVNSWMPPEFKITAWHVDLALRGQEATVRINVDLLRDKIDKSAVLYSARLNSDYQAILNEVLKDRDCAAATLADVVEAMALRPVSKPTLVVVGAATMVGTAQMR
jgi:hypothetical protein